MANKKLDATGDGVIDYDYKEDTLFFKVKGREYKKSIDFDDLVLDIDKEGFVTGVQIFGASKLFSIDKIALNSVKRMEFSANVERNVIKLRLSFMCVRRNKPIEHHSENFTRESTSQLKEGNVLCTVPA